MTTIITRKNKDGAITRRCDARCYNAKCKKCRCVCGGLNHGKGLEEAQLITDNNRDLIISNRNPGDFYIIQLQKKLFYG